MKSMKFEPVVIMTTTNTDKEAKFLAGLLVKERLAACVQIISKIQSIYQWNGKIHDEQEYLLLIKTKRQLVSDVKLFIEKNHSYEVPEFLVTPVTDAMTNYLDWMKDNTK